LINERPWHASLQGWMDIWKRFLNEYRDQLEAEHRTDRHVQLYSSSTNFRREVEKILKTRSDA
jgi:hypothetical protein